MTSTCTVPLMIKCLKTRFESVIREWYNRTGMGQNHLTQKSKKVSIFLPKDQNAIILTLKILKLKCYKSLISHLILCIHIP